jgi:VIT1/CCC1 family predicted Fe2+/Mn2+ transporter
MSYIAGGLVPLAPYFFIGSVHTALIGSVVVTLLALLVCGLMAGQLLRQVRRMMRRDVVLESPVATTATTEPSGATTQGEVG